MTELAGASPVDAAPPAAEPSAATLVLRYHSLGDVILTTGLIRELARAGRSAIDVATDPSYVPIFEGNPHVRRIWTRGELEADRSSAGDRRFTEVLDLQGTAGARRTSNALGPAQHLRSRSLERRWIVLWGDRPPRPRIPHVVVRYAEVAGLERSAAELEPEVWVTNKDRAEWTALCGGLSLAQDKTPTSEAPGEDSDALDDRGGRDREFGTLRSTPRIALLTGASRASKRYPRASFLEVAKRLQALGAEILWIDPPEEDEASPFAGVRVKPSLRALKAALASTDLVIGGDSGPGHLATALRRPTLILFGSTVPAFGFAPLGAASRMLAVEGLGCRPCGVHGRDRCWKGHWRCLRDLTPERVIREASEMLRK